MHIVRALVLGGCSVSALTAISQISNEQKRLHDFRFAVFGPEGQDLAPLVALIGTGRKKFLTVTRADLPADVPADAAPAQLFAAVKDRIQTKFAGATEVRIPSIGCGKREREKMAE